MYLASVEFLFMALRHALSANSSFIGSCQSGL